MASPHNIMAPRQIHNASHQIPTASPHIHKLASPIHRKLCNRCPHSRSVTTKLLTHSLPPPSQTIPTPDSSPRSCDSSGRTFAIGITERGATGTQHIHKLYAHLHTLSSQHITAEPLIRTTCAQIWRLSPQRHHKFSNSTHTNATYIFAHVHLTFIEFRLIITDSHVLQKTSQTSTAHSHSSTGKPHRFATHSRTIATHAQLHNTCTYIYPAHCVMLPPSHRSGTYPSIFSTCHCTHRCSHFPAITTNSLSFTPDTQIYTP